MKDGCHHCIALWFLLNCDHRLSWGLDGKATWWERGSQLYQTDRWAQEAQGYSQGGGDRSSGIISAAAIGASHEPHLSWTLDPQMLGVLCRHQAKDLALWALFFYIYIYLAVLSLRCGMQNLLECLNSVVVVHRLSCPVTCGILVPRPRIEPTYPALQGRW